MPITSSEEDPRVEKAPGYITSMLIPGEAVEVWTVQRRLSALLHRRVLIVAKSGRFIGITRSLLGGFNPVDFRWQDLKEAKLSIGIFGASILLTVDRIADLALASSGPHALSFTGLRKQQTQEIYRICQTHGKRPAGCLSPVA